MNKKGEMSIGAIILIILVLLFCFAPKAKIKKSFQNDYFTSLAIPPLGLDKESACEFAVRMKQKVLQEMKIYERVPEKVKEKLKCGTLLEFDKLLADSKIPLCSKETNSVNVFDEMTLPMPGKEKDSLYGKEFGFSPTNTDKVFDADRVLGLNALIVNDLFNRGFLPQHLSKKDFDVKVLRFFYKYDDFKGTEYTYSDLVNGLYSFNDFRYTDVDTGAHVFNMEIMRGVTFDEAYKACKMIFDREILGNGKTTDYKNSKKYFRYVMKEIFKLKDLLESDLSLKKIIKMGYKINDFEEIGLTVQKLIELGFRADVFIKIGADAKYLRAKGIHYDTLVELGFIMEPKPDISTFYEYVSIDTMGNPDSLGGGELLRNENAIEAGLFFYYKPEQIAAYERNFQHVFLDQLNAMFVAAGITLLLPVVTLAATSITLGNVATVPIAHLLGSLAIL